jgi:hypothetical protein
MSGLVLVVAPVPEELERVPATAVDEGLPELDISIYNWVLATDHLSGEG